MISLGKESRIVGIFAYCRPSKSRIIIRNAFKLDILNFYEISDGFKSPVRKHIDELIDFNNNLVKKILLKNDSIFYIDGYTILYENDINLEDMEGLEYSIEEIPFCSVTDRRPIIMNNDNKVFVGRRLSDENIKIDPFNNDSLTFKEAIRLSNVEFLTS